MNSLAAKSINLKNQNHLSFVDTINLGSYYTPSHLVNIVYEMITKNINNIGDWTILDNSCGYGSFFSFHKGGNNTQYIGADIDSKALEIAKRSNLNVHFFNHNSLKNVSRLHYGLSEQNKIIIVGNPPYNDTTSIIKNDIKKDNFEVDFDLKTRDLGMSFLLSYNKLKSDFVCVLHPLSYLIKKSNFSLLGAFKNNYKLVDSMIISSQEFSDTSRLTAFPIIIALYKKDDYGMDYNFIENYLFKTLEGKSFKLKDFDSIGNYIAKYPNEKFVRKDETVAFFWTMRDINALKRSRTFISEPSYNAIYVTKEKLDYYCFVDIFKDYIKNIPYYLGNCDVMINNEEFKRFRDIFRIVSLSRNKQLKKYVDMKKYDDRYNFIIENYFKNLLGEHFVYQ